MTDYPRFRPVEGGPGDAYAAYYGAPIVSLALRAVDWWLTRKRIGSNPVYGCQIRSVGRGARLALAVLTLSLLCLSGANLAAQEQCTGAAVDVVAPSSEERTIACSAAREALELLGRCKISARKRVSVHILSEVEHPQSGQIFGLFDPSQQRAFVTRLHNIPTMVEATPYALLPREAFYRSLIVHEIVHAVMHQNLVRPTTTHSAHEYPAYALQIESLPAELRDRFLQSFDQNAIQATALFSDPVLMFNPYFFAARAYRHFKASADGCANLTALLQGDADFIAVNM